jgi:K+-transporting ATPase c subunit
MNNFPMMQNLSGTAPTMQNNLAQQQMMQQAMQQGNQLSNQALGGQQSGGGLDPKMLAQALRKDNPMLSTAQNQEVRGLGSNPNNMMSGYNTGMFGWGNYGE